MQDMSAEKSAGLTFHAICHCKQKLVDFSYRVLGFGPQVLELTPIECFLSQPQNVQ